MEKQQPPRKSNSGKMSGVPGSGGGKGRRRHASARNSTTSDASGRKAKKKKSRDLHRRGKRSQNRRGVKVVVRKLPPGINEAIEPREELQSALAAATAASALSRKSAYEILHIFSGKKGREESSKPDTLGCFFLLFRNSVEASAFCTAVDGYEFSAWTVKPKPEKVIAEDGAEEGEVSVAKAAEKENAVPEVDEKKYPCTCEFAVIQDIAKGFYGRPSKKWGTLKRDKDFEAFINPPTAKEESENKSEQQQEAAVPALVQFLRQSDARSRARRERSNKMRMMQREMREEKKEKKKRRDKKSKNRKQEESSTKKKKKKKKKNAARGKIKPPTSVKSGSVKILKKAVAASVSQ